MTSQMKILDAYALMAFLEDEPGAQQVEDLLIQSLQEDLHLAITAVNLAEVYYNLARRYSSEAADTALEKLAELTIEIVAVDWELALQAARFKAQAPIAFADCMAAALAFHRDCPVVTGDQEFHRLAERVRIEWLST